MKSDARRMTPEKLGRMTRENVEYWLLHEMHKRAQDVDAGLIRQALARIAPVTEEDAEKAHLSLLTFHWEHDAQIAVRRRRRRQARAAALVLVLLTLMTAAGFTLGVNIWRVAYEWAAEQLLMQLRPNEGATLPDAGASGLEYIADVWGDAVYEMMMENDIHVSLPAWKPEGFALQHAERMRYDENTFAIIAVYATAGGEHLQMSIRRMHDVDALLLLEASLEADESLQDIAVAGGVHYFIMSNMDAVSLTWVDGTACVTISGDLDDTETKAIIHSIKSGGN